MTMMELHDVVNRVDALESFLEREGYRKCDAAACNCGSYHPGENHAATRLKELHDEFEAAGLEPRRLTILVAVKQLLSRLAKLKRYLYATQQLNVSVRHVQRSLFE